MKHHSTLLAIAAVVFSLSTAAHCDDISDYKAIEAAVKAGKLTKEEAAKKLAYLKKAAAAKSQKKPAPQKKAAGKSGQSDYKAIEAAVKAGKLTKEDAAEKLEYLKKAAAAKSQKKPAPKKKAPAKSSKLSDYELIEAAVKAGKLTKEEAAEKLEYLKKAAAAKSQKKPAPQKKVPSRSKLSDYQAIEAAVKSGKLTKEEAAKKLAYLKKAAAAKSQKKPAPPKKAPSKNSSQSDYKALEAAVKAGKLTKEEAVAKLAALKKNASTKSTKAAPKTSKLANDQAIQDKLAELVDSGLLSEAQAKAMLAAARKVGDAKKPVTKKP